MSESRKIPDREPDLVVPKVSWYYSWSLWYDEKLVVIHRHGEDQVLSEYSSMQVINRTLNNEEDPQRKILVDYIADKELLDL